MPFDQVRVSPEQIQQVQSDTNNINVMAAGLA